MESARSENATSGRRGRSQRCCGKPAAEHWPLRPLRESPRRTTWIELYTRNPPQLDLRIVGLLSEEIARAAATSNQLTIRPHAGQAQEGGISRDRADLIGISSAGAVGKSQVGALLAEEDPPD